MAFIETPRFPDDIAVYGVGGRGFNTVIVETFGGNEYRNSAWAQARGAWDISAALRVTNPSIATYNFNLLRDFFMVARGRFNAFRFKDFKDYKDDAGGVLVGLTGTTFQMYKTYTAGSTTYTQIIQKPKSATVVVTGGSTPVVDYTTGIVTVASGTPASWRGEFDIPARFEMDMPSAGLDSSGALYDWQSMKIVEVRNP